MRPEPDYFDNTFIQFPGRIFATCFIAENFVYKAMLTVDSSGKRAVQIARQPLKWGRVLEGIGFEYSKQLAYLGEQRRIFGFLIIFARLRRIDELEHYSSVSKHSLIGVVIPWTMLSAIPGMELR